MSNLTCWIDYGERIPSDAIESSGGCFTSTATSQQISSLINRGGVDGTSHLILASVHAGMSNCNASNAYVASLDRSVNYGLRADSHGAPSTHAEAVARGPPWPDAISKEISNHSTNESWDLINRSEVPAGRRIHKFVWVFKEKRDGTAKARLCVQGCTLEEGVDFDQTFAKPLRHASARGLFAYAARNQCKIRSIR